MRTKVLITGGHMTPALAVIEESNKMEVEFVWVGSKYKGEDISPEYKLVNDLGIKYYNITTGKLVRNWKTDTLYFLKNISLIPVGFIWALIIIIKTKPDIILLFGGHISLPFGILGSILGTRTILHEQTVNTGMANKILGKYVDEILVSWDESLKYFPDKKTILVGNPVRKSLFDTNHSLAVENSLPTIYITGGNQGSEIINQNIKPILPELLDKYNVIHQTGSNSIEFNNKSRGTYIQQKFFSKELGWILNNSDLIISRGGANSLTEVLAFGVPTIFIPIPWVTQNEQYKNAKMAEDIGLGLIIEEENLEPELLLKNIQDSIQKITSNTGLDGNSDLTNIKKISRSKVNLNSAKEIYNLLLT